MSDSVDTWYIHLIPIPILSIVECETSMDSMDEDGDEFDSLTCPKLFPVTWMVASSESLPNYVFIRQIDKQNVGSAAACYQVRRFIY